MSHSSPDLAALISSRICHDLISPIGAINNGLELLGMSGDTRGPELGLISESVESASARIRFFRLAFGAPSSHDIAAREIREILKDVSRAGKVQMLWDIDSSVPRSEVRLAFLALQCLDTAMAYGGTVTVTREDTGWTLIGRGEKFRTDDGLWAVLGDGTIPGDIAPAHVQFPLLALHCRDGGRALHAQIDMHQIMIRF